MTIRLVCENETGYDSATGTFTYCDHTFTCDDSLLAKVTKCPKCRNSIRVGSSRRHVWLETGQPVADTNAVSHQAIKEANRKVASPLDLPNDPMAEAAVQAAKTQAARKRRPRVQVAICPSCGTSVNESTARCPACRAELKRPKGLSSKSLKINRPVGAHRWMLRTAFAGISPTALAWGLHGVIFLLGIAITVISFYGLGQTAGTVATCIVLFLWLFYAYIYFCCYRACTDLAFRLRWWQRIFWNQLLRSARSKNWESDPTAGRARAVLDLRQERMNDELLLATESLTTCEVLDLEGCPISDQGAQPLHFLKDLRCLVIRGTAISNRERARLQLSLPACWIWY